MGSWLLPVDGLCPLPVAHRLMGSALSRIWYNIDTCVAHYVIRSARSRLKGSARFRSGASAMDYARFRSMGFARARLMGPLRRREHEEKGLLSASDAQALPARVYRPS